MSEFCPTCAMPPDADGLGGLRCPAALRARDAIRQGAAQQAIADADRHLLQAREHIRSAAAVLPDGHARRTLQALELRLMGEAGALDLARVLAEVAR